MPCQELPQRNGLPSVNPYFKRVPRAEFLKEQIPHRVKGVFAKATSVLREIMTMFSQAWWKNMIKEIDAVDVLFITREATTTQLFQRKKLLEIGLEPPQMVAAAGRR